MLIIAMCASASLLGCMHGLGADFLQKAGTFDPHLPASWPDCLHGLALQNALL